ncbi:Zn-dependent hydrolase [Sinorhizobium meliloti]|uniref:Zn-dependent hydrolase n=1 Tax=Rhizobium meliloti TaxID=382 RepID=UPI003D654A4D
MDDQRLWQRHLDMNRLGATSSGGNHRLALSREDHEARVLLARWAKDLGLDVSIDAIGNLFVRREGTDRAAAPVVTGSHLDTQPSGGRFDGTYGVLAGFEALQAIIEAGIETRHPIEVVSWTNEEGARFVPGYTGSAAFRTPARLDELLALKDQDGITVEKALASGEELLSHIRQRPLGGRIAAFVEAHIEQGPQLEETGRTIGVVTGIQGTRRFEVCILGQDAHAGTTPRRSRKDALSAAVSMIKAMEDLFSDDEDIARFTVGQFSVVPNASAVVPGEVRFTIDFRHPDAGVIASVGDRVREVCHVHQKGCSVTITDISQTAPVIFSADVIDRILSTSQRLGYPNMLIMSGAGHDALQLSHLAPTGMIFVPCEKGISHNEKENAKLEDLAAGARVLADVILDLAR